MYFLKLISKHCPDMVFISDFLELRLMHRTPSKNISRRHFKIFFFLFFFLQETGFDIPSKLSLKKTICMKCQKSVFWEKVRKNITSVSSAEFAQRVVKMLYETA